MNNRLYKDAQKHLEKGDYDGAFARAFEILRDEASLKPSQIEDLFDILSYCFESWTHEKSRRISDEEQVQLVSIAEKFADTGAHASFLFYLALNAYAREDYLSAEKLMSRSVAIVNSNLIEYKSSFLHNTELYIDALCWQSKFDQAISACEDWLRLANEELVENDIFTATIHKKLADIYAAQGKAAEAEEHLKRCIWLHENEACLLCSDAQSAIQAYASFLDGQGRSEEASKQRELLPVDAR
ncbi:MAG TPA: tetratricopeptide repeat protein [Drouetiella sp.]